MIQLNKDDFFFLINDNDLRFSRESSRDIISLHCPLFLLFRQKENEIVFSVEDDHTKGACDWMLTTNCFKDKHNILKMNVFPICNSYNSMNVKRSSNTFYKDLIIRKKKVLRTEIDTFLKNKVNFIKLLEVISKYMSERNDFDNFEIALIFNAKSEIVEISDCIRLFKNGEYINSDYITFLMNELNIKGIDELFKRYMRCENE